MLSRPGAFDSANSIQEGIRECGGEISLSTVSKALATLDDDLLIEKTRNRIRVLQAARLLDKFSGNYLPPAISPPAVPMRIDDAVANREQMVSQVFGTNEWVWDGSTSAAMYLDLPVPRVSVALIRARDRMLYEVRPGEAVFDSRFPNNFRAYAAECERGDVQLSDSD